MVSLLLSFQSPAFIGCNGFLCVSEFGKVGRSDLAFLVCHSVCDEVKSGSRYTLTSLTKCIAKYAKDLSTPYVMHDKDVKIENGIVFQPLYMTPLL